MTLMKGTLIVIASWFIDMCVISALLALMSIGFGFKLTVQLIIAVWALMKMFEWWIRAAVSIIKDED